MQHTQIILLEAPGGCNLTACHPECPAGALGRDRAKDHPLDPGMVAGTAVELDGLGFRGLYAFHWFSEPTRPAARPWLDTVMGSIRRQLPHARFLLWTNGTYIAHQDTWPWVAGFDRVFLSNYAHAPWQGLRHLCRDRLFVWDKPVMDPLMMTAPDRAGPPHPMLCRRPFTEFTITRDGDVHLCCQAWRPDQRIGNLVIDGLRPCVDRFLCLRRDVAQGDRVLDVNHVCHGCARPQPALGDFAEIGGITSRVREGILRAS